MNRVAVFCALAPMLSLTLGAANKAPLPVPDFQAAPGQISAFCATNAQVLDPEDSRLLAEYGRAYLASGQREKAEATFKAAIASDPEDGRTHFLIGYAWLRNGFKAEALQAFHLMQTSDPEDKNSFTRAAIVLLDADETEAAVMLMEKAYALDPKDWQNACEFGRACLRKGMKDAAAIWFKRTIDAKPREERMWNEIALAYADNGFPARTDF